MPPKRSVGETKRYSTFVKKSKGSFDKVDKSVRVMLNTFKFSSTDRNDCIFKAPNNKAEIWSFKLGDPQGNRGKSGGYRLVCIFLKDENKVILDDVCQRKDRNNQSVKNDYNNHLRELKKSLTDSYK